MIKSALFPGSFDPITLGHYDVVLRAAGFFDKVYVALGINSSKARFFPIEKSLDMINASFAGQSGIEVISYSGLTVELCRKMNIRFIVRGIRNVSDFEYERTLAFTNSKIYPELETIFLDSKPEYLPISSTVIRDLLRNDGDIAPFVPEAILPFI